MSKPNVTIVGAGSSTLVPFGTPAYAAGLETEDVVRTLDGQKATVEAWNGLHDRKPGDTVKLVVVSRDGVARDVILTLQSDPALELSDLGSAMTAAQRAFRKAWLGQ